MQACEQALAWAQKNLWRKGADVASRQIAQLNPGSCTPGHAAGDIVHIFHVVPNPEVRDACL